ncbi:MAG: hypothetical protein J6A37_06910 [Oscillospiraceae bacterium]|nr:hypothetical protein [Oscillospiraceae bacterium]
MTEKPIIRHCRNCRYNRKRNLSSAFEALIPSFCEVRYINVEYPRIRALTCRHYEPKNSKEVQDND